MCRYGPSADNVQIEAGQCFVHFCQRCIDVLLTSDRETKMIAVTSQPDLGIVCTATSESEDNPEHEN